jgi:hypothetical protein
MFFLFVIIILQLLTSLEAQRKIPNIDFLGAGYDVFLGNPRSKSRDPGFRGEILALSYAKETSSGDGKWLIPDNVRFLEELSCSYNVETVEVKLSNCSLFI